MERCYFCRGKITNQKVTHIHKWGEKIIIFENIDAEVCKQCGELYFRPEILDLMDKKTQTLTKPKRTIEVPVIAL